VQGWLDGTTPQRISPLRVHRRLRGVHGFPLTSHVRPFTGAPLQGTPTSMASADFCPITPSVTAERAAWVSVGSGGDSSAFALALSPAPLATTATLGFDGDSSPFGLALSSTPLAAQTASGTDLPG
jgi:hypothetical protein